MTKIDPSKKKNSILFNCILIIINRNKLYYKIGLNINIRTKNLSGMKGINFYYILYESNINVAII